MITSISVNEQCHSDSVRAFGSRFCCGCLLCAALVVVFVIHIDKVL